MRKEPTWTPQKIGTVIGLLVFAAALVVVIPIIDRARQRSELADTLRQVRSLKFALDGFATDFDGQFPNEHTGESLVSGGTGTEFSNDYFRQLFLSGETQSEKIFWTRRTPIGGPGPDDEIATEGRPDLSKILQAGECHWAYVVDTYNTSQVARPLILDPFVPGTTRFDSNLWNGHPIVLTVDGSAKVWRLDEEESRILDDSGLDLFAPEREAWKRVPHDPLELLMQPEPRP